MSGYNPMDTRAQERAQAEQADKARRDQREYSDDLNRVMSNKSGRRFMRRLLAETGVYRESFDPNALRMAHREGERNVGLRLLAAVQSACPERYLEMLQEHSKDERSSNDRSTSN